MSVHKLTAGSGYEYLTRQVAAHDATALGQPGLASYYTAQGESPGVWVGRGMDGLVGLDAGDQVTAEQMRNLFGNGVHPLAEALRREAGERGADARGQVRAAWLGTPYRVYANDVSSFRRRVAQLVAESNLERGLPAGAPAAVEDRARVRTQVAVELFRAEFGRDPADPREVAATIARHSRPRTNAVAGYDLTFSPVKSVSTLWALAPPQVAAAIERAHQTAVADALTYLEDNALFTREGSNGVRQVQTRGLVAAAFTHRDSRAGDPDLHTHVAVANKVQTRRDGRWLAIDGRLIFKANVAASETYNTRLEHYLRTALGVRFQARPTEDPRTRPVREIVGVDPALNRLWSSRRESIQARRAVLAQQFQATHGRPPSPVESIQLAQQATLETRDAKHEPRALADQRATWARQARTVLGGDRAVAAMIATVLAPPASSLGRVDAAWVHATAARIADTVQARRSHWQRWHVEAEALRQVRDRDLSTDDIDRVVAILVDEVLTLHSVRLTDPGDDVEVPDMLRRDDGSSVYSIASSARYTSPALLAAEARVVAAAGRLDGARVPADIVEDTIAASAAAGVPLNAGQRALVQAMATSGARVQLAIAPAGTGKTTAMAALAQAWTSAGGEVLGLAPSAAAAAVLGDSIGAATDTMAKLSWHLTHPTSGDLPDWAQRIGPTTLVVIDEAGMADTMTLDTVTTHVLAAGGSVRLIGDDQQLAAVGAGGVLRDIAATHGALHLSELMRFTDPAEGAASLALREGLPEALGFYLDRDRVHVGDLATITDDVFTAWRRDRAAGLDAVMLAPTRDLVAHLNQQARQHRLDTTDDPDLNAVALADGNHAGVGDTVITRRNDRALRVAATDWVKNGDRWQVTALRRSGALTVRHLTSGRVVDLPAAYVCASVELGYAATIHTAQGVTAHTSHTLLTGAESRQLAYTAATRGRLGNHLYLQVVGDGDEHTIIRPDHTHPPTATDLLESLLARDDSSRSATTIGRDAADPTHLLGDAVARYVDSLNAGAEHLLGAEQVARLDAAADTIVPNLTHAPAWPTLRAHLILRSARGLDPVHQLHTAATLGQVDTATDVAAVIDWRLDDTCLSGAGTGPLPWLPAIPDTLADDPTWGPYLAARAARVRDLRDQVAEQAAHATGLPGWARQGQARPATDLLADVAIWRAATAVPPTDRRPTGPTQLGAAANRWQGRLNTRLAGNHTPALAEWGHVFDTILTHPRRDPFTPLLAQRLAAISRAGLDAPTMVRQALADRPLPDDHNGAALWWRIAGRLAPAVAAHVENDHHLNTAWTPRLADLIGADQASVVRQSPWWPTLVAVIDHALARGANLQRLLADLPDEGDDVDPCQALVWRISVLTDPPPTDNERDTWPTLDEPASTHDGDSPFWEDLDHPPWAPTDQEWATLHPLSAAEPDDPDQAPGQPADATEPTCATPNDQVDEALFWAARAREFAQVLPPTDRQVDAQLARAHDADTAAVSPARIRQLNRLALAYYTSRFPGTWAQRYLTERVGVDLTGDPHLHPGYAPAGWTTLVTHLRRHGATDLELVESGLATTTAAGRIIDRFRDRLILPITALTASGPAEPLGFVARRHPHLRDQDGGPKYLNTADTALFHKGAQLYAVRADLLAAGATPVLVEGPLDALAVTLAGAGRYVGLAPLGTALTEEQATQLATLAHQHRQVPLVATDADPAGQIAAHRDYWLLTQHGLDPHTVALRPGSDPADLLALHGPEAVRQLLDTPTPLSQSLLTERLDHLTGMSAVRHGVVVVAAGHPHRWDDDAQQIAHATGIPLDVVRRELAAAVRRWDQDPHGVAAEQTADLSQVRARNTAALASAPPGPGAPPTPPTRREPAPPTPATLPQPGPRR